MAQVSRQDLLEAEAKNVEDNKKESGGGSFRFNAAAPEFVPRVKDQPQAPSALTSFFYPCFPYLDETTGSWIYVAADGGEVPIPSPVHTKPNPKLASTQNQPAPKDIPFSDDLKEKIIKQAEYMFSDMSMLANESFAKHVFKDPQGYVPINFVSTKKKLKSLNVTNQMVAQALISSSKLVLSNDGKRVKRKQPFTEKEKEDLMLRTVIAENLPEDHSHQNIEKIFNVVGSIKAIRICQPQEPNSARSSKADSVVSNKLHALVEYDNHETAESAAEKLNDERNWRKGMRVRVMLKRTPKSVLKTRKSDFDRYLDDEGPGSRPVSRPGSRPGSPLHEDISRLSSLEASDDEGSPVMKKSWSRNWMKSKHNRPQLQTMRSMPTSSSSHLSSSILGDISARPLTTIAKGPRMPDGTKGFAIGRGKPLTPFNSS